MNWSDPVELFNLFAGVVGIFGTAFALWTHYRTRIFKIKEEANLQILEERFRGLQKHLAGSYYNANLLVRRGDPGGGASVQELQNLARALRTEIICMRDIAQGLDEAFADHRPGQLLSGPGGIDSLSLELGPGSPADGMDRPPETPSA